ncbi:ribonuclease H-like domain-containing protein [Tanacetum coccineum]|uniref:Ribonuclease H-like domain-containing protein n=1 Tax=Tanacetum coccineum TaxID=301880 RepID=A0ABQ5GGE9_9ASTR
MAEEEDRISLLPDCLLLEIISRLELPTKQVIKTTTTISKRWQHLWTRLPTLVFIDQDRIHDSTNCYSFIDKTLTQCPTDVSLRKFKFQIMDYSFPANTARHASQVNNWIHYAITHNVQEVEIRMWERYSDDEFSYDDELFFNNSCIMSMKLSHPLSHCVFNPPNGTVSWDKLKCLCIEYGTLDEHSIGISTSPCLETLELNDCYLDRRFLKSFFGNFGVERLSCKLETYERFSYDLFDDDEFMSIKFSRCEFNPPNGAIRWDKLTFLCIDTGKLVEDSIGQILSRSPCLETLELKRCCGFRRIDVTSKSVKNLVLDGYGDRVPGESYIDTLVINAPYILSLKIRGKMYLEQFLLENVSSLVKADLSYFGSRHFAEYLGRNRDDIEKELLRGLLSSLGHVNEIVLAEIYALGECTCLIEALSRLEATGFQFRKGSDLRGSYPYCYRVFSLIDVAAAAENQRQRKKLKRRENQRQRKKLKRRENLMMTWEVGWINYIWRSRINKAS